MLKGMGEKKCEKPQVGLTDGEQTYSPLHLFIKTGRGLINGACVAVALSVILTRRLVTALTI